MAPNTCVSLFHWLLLLLVLFLVSAASFSTSSYRRHPHVVSVKAARSSFDYEYLPFEDDGSKSALWGQQQKQRLPSSYPPNTPAGLRGEAVRSALAAKCVAWKFDQDNPLRRGILQCQGTGTRAFLNGKLTHNFPSEDYFATASLLTSKGAVVDELAVALCNHEAYLFTSPGHDGSSLFRRLDPFVFPMDQVTLQDGTEDSCIFSLASTRIEHIQEAVQDHLKSIQIPKNPKECVHVRLEEDGSSLIVIPHVGLPDCVGFGCTFCFWKARAQGDRIWKALISESNPEGPVEIGALEYESLRIQAGQPAFGTEWTGSLDSKNQDNKVAAASPLELHMKVDMDKGCYLGQEGVASIWKNPRGPPRLLYSVVFEDHENLYSHQTNPNDKTENLTKLPQPGDRLFVLGSNEEISVGTLTSVAEPGGTGDACLYALGLIRRPDSILKQMKQRGLELPSRIEDPLLAEATSSGMIAPPPLDPLDGLEVIVGGSYTVGFLKMIPSRSCRPGENMFEVPTEGYIQGSEAKQPFEENSNWKTESITSISDAIDVVQAEVQAEDDTMLQAAMEEAAKAQEEAEKAAAEAQRKAEKLEMLKKRAEEAMARRKQKTDAVAEENEAKRKAEKMAMLKKRAEEAMARRRNKKEPR